MYIWIRRWQQVYLGLYMWTEDIFKPCLIDQTSVVQGHIWITLIVQMYIWFKRWHQGYLGRTKDIFRPCLIDQASLVRGAYLSYVLGCVLFAYRKTILISTQVSGTTKAGKWDGPGPRPARDHEPNGSGPYGSVLVGMGRSRGPVLWFEPAKPETI